MYMRLSVLVLLAVVRCYACDCKEPSVQAKRDHADIIFRGTIIELHDSSKPATIAAGFAHDSGKVVVFKVTRIWKGHVGETFGMPGIEETSACIGFWPGSVKVGQDLLVYASHFGTPDYLTSICGNHKPAKDAEKDFKELGPGKEPERSSRTGK
jgi:hypothetical protein